MVIVYNTGDPKSNHKIFNPKTGTLFIRGLHGYDNHGWSNYIWIDKYCAYYNRVKSNFYIWFSSLHARINPNSIFFILSMFFYEIELTIF